DGPAAGGRATRLPGEEAKTASGAVEGAAQLGLRTFEHLAPVGRQIAAGAVDVEVQHGHGGLQRRAFAPGAGFRRSLQRLRDPGRIVPGEDARLEVESVAGP